MSDTDVLDRLAELEARTGRMILAGDARDQNGWGALNNWIEGRLAEERSFEREVVSQALAMLRDEILTMTKTMVEALLSKTIRGTHDLKADYSIGDVVAKDGASFICKRSSPGPCPGDGWQLLARQGQRGIAGPKGEPGAAAPRIVGWVVDRARYTITPLLAGGGPPGPVLDLSCLFSDGGRDGT